MNKIFTITFIFLSTFLSAQNLDAEPQNYLSFEPGFTSTYGGLSDKFSPTIEFGRQWQDVFTMGLALGKTTSSNRLLDDVYLEIRPNLNVFQVGKFVNTFTPGIGYVFGPNSNLMLEFTSGIEYSYSDKIHFNVSYGSYTYSGKSAELSRPSTNFVAFSIVRFFKPTKTKGLIGK